MCEMCKIRKETEDLNKELEFRFVQFQVELQAGRVEEAQKCQDRATEIADTIFANLRRKASIELQLSEGASLEDILSKALN